MLGDDDPALATLHRRVQLGGWWLFLSTAALAFGELSVRPGDNPRVTLVHGIALVVFAALLAVLPTCRTRARTVALALAGALFATATSFAIAVVTGSSATSLIVLATLTLVPAVFVPWGWPPQLVVALCNTIAYPLELVFAENADLVSQSRPALGLLVVAAGSVYAAYELERQRRLTQAEQRERRAREQELERQRAFLRQVIDINPHLVFAKDRAGRFTLVNRAVAEVYGTTVEDLIGRTDSDFNGNPDEVDHFRSDDLRVIETGEELFVPAELITDATGRRRWLNTVKRPLRSGDDPPDQILGVATDITEHRLAQEELRENAAIAAALARMGEGIIASLNQPGLLGELCRLTCEALEGDTAQLWLRDDECAVWVPASHAGEPAERWETIKLLPLPAALLRPYVEAAERGGAVWIAAEEFAAPLLRLTPDLKGAMCIALRSAGSAVGMLLVKYMASTAPTTPRHERIARATSQLASLALENARLHEQVERANRLKSEFMATMSHELRTPLNVIIGYADLLLEGAMGPLPAEQSGTVARLQQNALQLFDLINATLDVSRLESGNVPLDFREVDLAEVLRDVEVRTRDARNGEGPGLTVHLPAQVGPLVTDGAKLKIILTNLVANALKFTREGHVVVRVTSGDDRVDIAVSDTGVGIPKEAQELVFEPFRQADETIRAKYGGVGLGLFIVKRLADALGGDVGLESTPGRGTTFRVRLPRTPERARPGPRARAA